MNIYLKAVRKQAVKYKELAEKAVEQLDDDQIFWQFNEESNSVAILIKHIAGNMISRFTDFLTTDGEKPWRNRDGEFEAGGQDRSELLELWNKGWNCMFSTLDSLTVPDLEKTVYLRKTPYSVLEVIMMNLNHYTYHVGQIVYVAKMLKNSEWKTLSIPRKK